MYLLNMVTERCSLESLFVMTDTVPSDVLKNSEESQFDWRIKACELLEQHIEELKLNNASLVRESYVLASCLRDLLTEIEALKSSSPVIKSLSDEEIMDYLLHYQCIVSSNEADNIHLLSNTGFQHISQKPDHLSSYSKSTKSSTDSEEFQLVQNNEENKSENLFDDQLDDNRSSCQTTEYSDEEHVDSDDPELIQAAFRLFAKYIGPSLKREHRTIFNAPPTQDWLTNQLLLRWERLSTAEKSTWRKRLKSS
ncbi:unnamed protein product [Heterobilharzia americana]|nr:unnamed protein product [Heterobilharzia americana]CAH8455442.1 unnamed protein product [Heterobilharzia americana]